MGATESSAWRDDFAGVDLAGYRLLRRLGAGAMAEVYLAEQRSLGRHVAVKMLRQRNLPGEEGDDRGVARFEQEARAAAALVHGNIVQIHEIGCERGIHFIAEEYVAGPSLKRWLSIRGPLTAAQGVALLSQVAAALDAAFQRGIVHRDIKPDNLLLTPTGEVKVADFGLARVLHEDDSVALTQDGFTLGTPLYMSPEQVEGRPVDTRSDLYSLGATAYHLLVGKPPFEGTTSMAVALAHVRTRPESLAVVRADLPGELAMVVDRLLAKDSADRFQTPAELSEDLEGLVTRGVVGRIQGALAWPDWHADAAGTDGVAGHSNGSMPMPSGRSATVTGRSARSNDLRAATLRLAAAIGQKEEQQRLSRRFWLATAAGVAGMFAVGYAVGRTRPRRVLKLQNPR